MKRALSFTLALTLLLTAVISVGMLANAQLTVRYVDNFTELIAARDEAKTQGGNMEIVLNNHIEMKYQLGFLQLDNMILNGNGFMMYAASDFDTSLRDPNLSNTGMLVTIDRSTVTVQDITLQAGSAMNRHTLNVYGSIVTLIDVKLDHSRAVGGAALMVNSSTVTVEETFEAVTGSASWYPIGVSMGSGEVSMFPVPTLVLDVDAEVTLSGTGNTIVAVGEGATIENPEKVDLKVDKNGNFVPTSTLDSISIVPIYEILKVGGFLQLEVNREPVENTTPFTFASSDENVAMVNGDGLVVAVGEGAAVITVTCASETATCTVTVVAADPDKELSVFERVMAFFTMIIQLFIDFFSNIG